MAGKQRTLAAPAALLPTLVLLCLLLLVWAAATGPVSIVRGSGRGLSLSAPTPSTPTARTDPGPGNLREATRDVRPQFHLAWLGDLVVSALLLALCVAALLALRWGWRHRWHPPPRPEPVDFEVLPDAVAEALRRRVDGPLTAVETGAPADGIVACWLRLQEILAEAGVAPLPSETSAEFVVRTLHALDLDPRAIGTLAALYREARFSRHLLGEEARTTARAALHTLHEELRSREAMS